MIELSIQLAEDAAEAIRTRAAEAGRSVDDYLVGLAAEDARRAKDALAEEGYRLLSQETLDFAEAALPLARETWPRWENEPPGRGGSRRTTCRDEILHAIQGILRRQGGTEVGINEVIEEMHHRGTSYPASTIRTHMTAIMCSNAPKNHATVYNDLERIGRGRYRLARKAD